MNKIIIFIMVLLSVSCSSLRVENPATIKELLPVGSTLRLTQALDIPKERSSIYIANGKVAPLKNFNTVDIYDPYCMLRLHNEAAHARQVMPDQFKVTKVVEWEGYYSGLKKRNVANITKHSGGMSKVVFFGNNDSGFSIIMHATVIGLHSDTQPEVKEIVCGHWDEQSLVEPLTLKQMKTALGELLIVDNN